MLHYILVNQEAYKKTSQGEKKPLSEEEKKKIEAVEVTVKMGKNVDDLAKSESEKENKVNESKKTGLLA